LIKLQAEEDFKIAQIRALAQYLLPQKA
jgi:hypothetical protein